MLLFLYLFHGKHPKKCEIPVTIAVTGILAEWEGFEPSSRVTDYTISNRARYDHFDTTPSRSYCIFSALLSDSMDYYTSFFPVVKGEFSARSKDTVGQAVSV